MEHRKTDYTDVSDVGLDEHKRDLLYAAQTEVLRVVDEPRRLGRWV